MQKFQQFLEAKDGIGERHKAQVEIAEALRGIFKKYSLTTCRQAWEKITSKKGEEQVQKLINNKSISLSAFHAL
jgi:hypothetical protein